MKALVCLAVMLAGFAGVARAQEEEGAPPSAEATPADVGAKEGETKAKPTGKPSQRETFLSLLREYKRFPKEYFTRSKEKIDPAMFEKIDYKLITQLSPSVLEARYKEFNVPYIQNKRLLMRFENEARRIERDLKSMPLTDPNRKMLELNREAHKGRLEQARYIVFLDSISANESFMQAVATLTPEARARAAAAGTGTGRSILEPKLPGQKQMSAVARRKMRASEKDFLTPVDPEFYETQLGKKLEADLKGRVDFWSYDYGSDALYVSSGNDLAKVTIFKDQGGVRFIRTRAGASFSEARAQDERVDMLKAKGRFLTGDVGDDGLFGKMPDTRVRTIEEDGMPPGHHKNDGHDHSGHNHDH